MIAKLNNWIKSEVAKEALNYYGDTIKDFFNDLSNYGCVCWMISSLCWYSDTHRFYDKHYDEIEGIREEWEGSAWEHIKIKWDLKNFFAWFAFESIAYDLAEELWITY